MNLMSLAKYEQQLKWIALGLGILSTIAIIRDWYPWTMFIGLPFCLIWAYCGWLHSERQPKWINLIFMALYGYNHRGLFPVITPRPAAWRPVPSGWQDRPRRAVRTPSSRR